MGIYDRPYYSDAQDNWPQTRVWSQRSVISQLIIVNVAIFIANAIFGGQDRTLIRFMELTPENAFQPWQWWRVLTYAFAHDPQDIFHLFWNMLGLWFLGRAVEEHYGRFEFLRIYLTAAIFGGVVFLVGSNAMGRDATVVGASGAVIAVEMLFVLLFPKAQLLLFGALPIPAWALGIFLVFSNVVGGGERVAYDVHLAGIAFAFAYFFLHWNLGNIFWFADFSRLKKTLFGPRLRVVRAESSKQVRDEEEADRLLKKIFDHGQDSLTAKEKRFLEKYSQEKRARRSSSN